MRLNDDKLGLLCSQEDLTNYACMKKQESREDVSSAEAGGVGGGGGGALLPDYAIESPVATAPHHLMLTKQNSFEHDESLGILTPDQMTDFTVALESSRTPSCENLSGYANSGKFLGGKNNSVLSGNRHLDIAACLPSIEALIPSHDRSPSLEELPLDPKPGVIIVDEEIDLLDATLSNEAEKCIESPLHRALNGAELSPKKVVIDSTETSEHTSEPTTRCSVSSGHTLPTSFITSVTSITSLEAGYQGDGENSRPASRGAEPLSVAPPASLIVSAACRQDPMTDSDFFTESDADAHEEIVRGDRRAQVIDGTLFCVPNERRCASFEPGEEMDSSGIYSDIDKRLDSIGVDAEGYADGDHTTDTGDTGDTEISMKSQPSPREKTPVTPLSSKNILSPQSVLNDTMESTASTAEVTVIKCQKNEQNTATKSKSSSVSNKENSAPLKKYKMPKRNVISKIKTMIESNQNIAKEESENEPRRLQRQQRKNGRWDAVMNKIEAGKQRGRSLKKEVKSRVLQNLGTSSSSTASTSSTRRSPGDNNNNANNSKDKRRIRGRPDTNSPNQETARSSVRSSASDLSSANSKETLKRPLRKNCIDPHQPNNNQLNGNVNKTNLSTVRKAPSIKSVQSNVNAKQKNATTNKVADRNNASNNRTTGPVGPAGAGVVGKDSPPAPVLNNQVVLNNNNNNQNNHSNHNHHHHHHIGNNNNAPTNIINHAGAGEPLSTAPAPAGKDTREQESQADLLPAAVAEEPSCKQLEPGWAKRAEDTVQALAVTVQYFTRQLENNPSDRLRNELERMRSELLATKSELEDLGLRKTSVEDVLNQERAEHIQALENLHEALKRQQASLEQSVLEERRRADGLEEREREYKAALELALTRQQQQQLLPQQQQVAPEQTALLAEVESLRTVMELRSQESAQLRSEVDILRRELDEKETMRQRCEALEARCEDLKAQLDSKESFERQLAHDNEVLMGSIHQLSKQNKRLSQRNEELLWRLRQKNEVVSVLTNQLTPQSQRLSKSLGPSEHSETTESSCSQKSEQSCSIVKYMVEKGDSVSWTLDITESMETSSGSVTGDTKASTPNSARRFREASGSGGGLVARQSSLRLSMPRRTTAPNSSGGSLSSRARSNSVSVVPENATPATRPSTAPSDEQVWSPNCSSTPLQRRRNVAANATPVPEQTWSLSSAVAETLSTSSNSSSGVSNGGAATHIGPVAKGGGPLETSTTDEDEEEEEEEVGQRPQEAGGEAMISEETSASSSSSEEDESSVSSGDIP